MLNELDEDWKNYFADRVKDIVLEYSYIVYKYQ